MLLDGLISAVVIVHDGGKIMKTSNVDAITSTGIVSWGGERFRNYGSVQLGLF